MIDDFDTMESPRMTYSGVTGEKKRFILSQLCERFLRYTFGDKVHLKRLK